MSHHLLAEEPSFNRDSVPYTTMENLYGEDNEVLNEFFPANSYINFGFHPGQVKTNHKITTEERIRSEEALYDYVFDIFQPEATDSILEVGSGRGDGCVRLKSAFSVACVKGVDVTAAQILRSTIKHKDFLSKDCNLSFHVGSAENLPFPPNIFSKIYSVEAAQHFQSLRGLQKSAIGPYMLRVK